MLVVTLFGGVATAAAPKKIAPPGNAGATQYEEDVPTAQGSQPVATLPPGSGGGTATPLPAAVSRKLNADGANGRAALSVAEQTTPPAPAQSAPSSGTSLPGSGTQPASGHSPTSSGSPAAASGGTRATIPLSSARGSGAATALAGSLGGSGGGLGLALPILLGASVLAASVLVFTQRRRRS
jgi:hypothetical protein